METMVFDQGRSTYLVNTAHVVKRDEDLATTMAEDGWSVEGSNPFLQWIAGDFVEADNPNENTQFWTAGDLEMSEYSIRHAPLNMLHKFRQPVGFFAATKSIKLERAAERGSLKIRALSGLWTHIFPFESAQVESANDAGLLFYSMECRGSHLVCGTDKAKGLEGCGETFDYMQIKTHCEHLLDRSSVRHIVNPTFRGGALVIPPVQPGWKHAHAETLSDAVMAEAATYAALNEAQFEAVNAAGGGLTATAWEMLMAQISQYARSR
jgi:hypothetical protein